MKNKKILLGGLLLLLVVTIGYALLSETINISGTATASGEFNMEFSEVGSIVEAGSTGATAQISGDKNTLTITVPRLEYPGASVEIPVTIHNAGTIDAKLDSIDVNGLTEEDRSIVVTHSGLTEQEELASMSETPETAEAIDEDQAVSDDVEKSLEAIKEENEKLKEDFLRVLADSENLKKRCASEIEKNNKYAISSFAKDLLGVADNLQRALDAAKDGEDNASLLKGVELTQNELMHVFSKFGIEKMQVMDSVFDPNFHRVAQEVEDKSKPADTIIAELQTGYMINCRLLREAMVVVTKGGK